MLKPLANQIGWNPDNSKTRSQHRARIRAVFIDTEWIAVGLAGYALIELIEAVGLWLMKRWGEYFAVIATSVFLPLEIYELTEKITALRLFALVINIVAVIWLLWSKRLFGLNGGGKAYREEHEAESLLSVDERWRRAEPLPAQRHNLRLRLQGSLVLQRVGNRMCAVLHAELGQDRLDVVADRLGADVQFGGDLCGCCSPAASRSKTWR